MFDVILSIYPDIPSVVQLIAAGVFVVVGIYSSMKRTYLTYVLTNPKTNQKYIGRASGIGEIEKIVRRRLYNHKYFKKGFTEVKVDKAAQGLEARFAIRGREQLLIDYHGGIGADILANKIRAIAKLNAKIFQYYKLSNKLFGKLK